MKSAIVTGANGFVGRALVRELEKSGVDVISIVHCEPNCSPNHDSQRVIVCSMEDYSRLPERLAGRKVDVFYHLAWAGTSGLLRGDERVQLSNVQGTCDAVRAASVLGCEKFIFASSIMEYEVEAEVRAMNYPLVSSIYSTAKLTADYMARILAGNQKISYISALISNIYGPGERSPRLINSTIRKLLRGEHVALSPGEQMYDFLYITDAARMFTALGEKGVSGRTYYLGSRFRQPLKVFLRELAGIVAPACELGFGELPFRGKSLSYEEFDTALLARDTGCQSEVSFAEGIRNTMNWMIEQEKNP